MFVFHLNTKPAIGIYILQLRSVLPILAKSKSYLDDIAMSLT